MKKIVSIYLMSVSVLYAQQKTDFNKFSGVELQIQYTQIADNQSFCTYESVENAQKQDELWKDFSSKELKKYPESDSVKLRPIHQFSLEYKQRQCLFIKYIIEKKGQLPTFLVKNFQKSNNQPWVVYTPTDKNEIELTYLFKHIKTDIFQKLFSRDTIVGDNELNNFKNKVLQSDGFVNFNELYRQLKLMETKPAALAKYCDFE